MVIKSTLTTLVAAACCSAATTTNTTLPSLNIPACASKASLSYDLSSPDRVAFPHTAVEVCYDDSSLRIDFLAYNETSFFYNSTYTTNGDIYNYEVMEVFIAKGTSDPQTYLEFEVAPNNVTFQVSKAIALGWVGYSIRSRDDHQEWDMGRTRPTDMPSPPPPKRASSTTPRSTEQTARPSTPS